MFPFNAAAMFGAIGAAVVSESELGSDTESEPEIVDIPKFNNIRVDENGHMTHDSFFTVEKGIGRCRLRMRIECRTTQSGVFRWVVDCTGDYDSFQIFMFGTEIHKTKTKQELLDRASFIHADLVELISLRDMQ